MEGWKEGGREGGRRDGMAPSVKLIMYCEIASSSSVSPLRRSPSRVASGQARQGGSHSLSCSPKRDRDSPAVDPDVRHLLKRSKLGVYASASDCHAALYIYGRVGIVKPWHLALGSGITTLTCV